MDEVGIGVLALLRREGEAGATVKRRQRHGGDLDYTLLFLLLYLSTLGGLSSTMSEKIDTEKTEEGKRKASRREREKRGTERVCSRMKRLEQL